MVASESARRRIRGSLLAAVVASAACVGLGGPWGAVQEAPPREQREGHDHDATARHRFDDPERWAAIFEDPERDTWQKPEFVLDVLGVGPGQVVADLGAGTGYFTVRLARRVGPTGRVYAVDIEPKLIEYLRERAERESLPRVVPVLAEPDDPKLPEGALDLVLIVNTWHHIDDRIRYLGRLRRVLKPGGRVAVVDFREGELPVGPPPGHKLSREHIVGEFAEAGWTLAAESDALPYQYVLVFAPPAGSGAREGGKPSESRAE